MLLTVVRAAWATRHDGLTIDEPYHLVAGAAYARLGDYRLNPEHPPLVKLWLGAALPPSVLPVPPFRPGSADRQLFRLIEGNRFQPRISNLYRIYR